MINYIRKYLQNLNIKHLIKQPVFKNIMLVMSITLLMKGVGFYKESVVAATFGLSELLDTFFIAMLVPGFINSVFLGAFRNVFIPNYVAELKTGNNIASFQGTGFFITGLVSFLFLLIAYLFTDIYLEKFFAGHDQAYYDLVKLQFHYVLPCILLWGFSSILSGLLNINGEFRYTSFTTIFTPVSIIICLWLFKNVLGDSVLALGTLIGAIIGFIYLLVISFKRDVISVTWPDFSNKNAKEMFYQLPAKVSSGFLTGMNGVVDQYFAAQLAVGSIAALNYGLKMPAFLSGILIIGINSVLLPYFSKAVIENKKKTFKLLFRVLKSLFIGAAIFSIIAIFATDFFVQLFFERNEFTAEDSALVSIIQKIILAYIPFTIAGMVTVNFLTSINKNAIMAYVSFGALVINIILDYILIQYYGIFGIAICTTVVVIIKNLVLFGYTVKLSRQEEILKT